MRRIRRSTLLGTCLMLLLSVAAVPGVRAVGGEADAAPAPAAVEDTAAAPDVAGECLIQPAGEPILLAPRPPQTCEECQAECDADYTRCIDRCHTRDCLLNCDIKYFTCYDKCPC